jgi:hypothetical protein
MPKKTRKMKQRAAMRRAVQPADVQTVENQMPEAQVAEQAPVRMRPTFGPSRAVTPMTFDYSHIYSDLKRIALFAGFFFIVLIALSFVIK